MSCYATAAPKPATLWFPKNKEFAMQIVKSTLLVCASALALMASGASHADLLNLGATLSGAAEVPPNTSAGMGQLQAEFDKATNTFSYTLRYSGLSGPVKAGHFHGPAEAGNNAGVALGINNVGESPVQGRAVLTAAQAADLLAGKWYVNLHTAANPGGEVRGQVIAE
jgi:hypothetical protein